MTDTPTGASSIGPLTKEVRDRLSPDDVIALMLEGNVRFRTSRCYRPLRAGPLIGLAAMGTNR